MSGKFELWRLLTCSGLIYYQSFRCHDEMLRCPPLGKVKGYPEQWALYFTIISHLWDEVKGLGITSHLSMSCTSLRSGSDPMTHFRMGLGCHLMPLRWGSDSITPDHRFMPSTLESLTLSGGAKVMALSGGIYWGVSRVEIILTLTLFLASTFISTRGKAVIT
ncbi:hypothetical protein BHM03_00048072 [Ensete ventricosum]|nr:hypothetical protein BHM03_00048072 [Ensete ventricosum]